jgi:hypothetical protein
LAGRGAGAGEEGEEEAEGGFDVEGGEVVEFGVEGELTSLFGAAVTCTGPTLGLAGAGLGPDELGPVALGFGLTCGLVGRTRLPLGIITFSGNGDARGDDEAGFAIALRRADGRSGFAGFCAEGEGEISLRGAGETPLLAEEEGWVEETEDTEGAEEEGVAEVEEEEEGTEAEDGASEEGAEAEGERVGEEDGVDEGVEAGEGADEAVEDGVAGDEEEEEGDKGAADLLGEGESDLGGVGMGRREVSPAWGLESGLLFAESCLFVGPVCVAGCLLVEVESFLPEEELESNGRVMGARGGCEEETVGVLEGGIEEAGEWEEGVAEGDGVEGVAEGDGVEGVAKEEERVVGVEVAEAGGAGVAEVEGAKGVAEVEGVEGTRAGRVGEETDERGGGVLGIGAGGGGGVGVAADGIVETTEVGLVIARFFSFSCFFVIIFDIPRVRTRSPSSFSAGWE